MDMHRYLDLFIAESRDHLLGAYEVLNRLETDSPNEDLWRELLRHAHSLKGMAATMGYDSMVALAHAAEDLADEIAVADPAGRASLPLLGDALACLGQIVDRVERGEDPHCGRAVYLAGALRGRGPDDLAAAPAAAALAERIPPDPPAVEATRWCVRLDVDAETQRSARSTVRLLARAATLGPVVRGAPPAMDIATGRFAGRVLFTFESTDPRDEIERRLESIDGIRAWSLELESAAESRPDPAVATHWLRVRADRVDAAIERVLELRRENERHGGAGAGTADRARLLLDEIHGELMDMRLVPFGSVAHRIHQGVRELASDMGKPLRFSIEGEAIRLDRRVLDALVDPLLHAVRNGLDHGIEPPDERRAHGKDVEGKLCLRLERHGDRVWIFVEDDGRGLDPDQLRRAAVAAGQIDAAGAAALDDGEALMLATLPNVSTASRVSHVSGRGVGLDVVREAVKRLGGFLAIRSSPGAGTSLCLSVPFSVALFAALLVRSRGQLFAVPMAAVERAIDTHAPAPFGGDVPAPLRLDERLGLMADAQAAPDDPNRWLITIRAGDRTGGLRVDEIIGHKELVVEPLRGPISRLRHYAGAALLDDGTIALVLDPTRLLGATTGAFRPSA